MSRFLVAVEKNDVEEPKLRFSVRKLGDDQELPDNVQISVSTIFFFMAEIEADTTEEVLQTLSILTLNRDSSMSYFLAPKEWKTGSHYYLGRLIYLDDMPYVFNPYTGTLSPVYGKEFKLIQL